MSPGRARHRFFEEFQEHTRLKHAVLTAYVQEWAAKLLHWGGAGNVVWFVDAFAGAGRDDRGRAGSPLIVGQIAADVRTGRMRRPEGRNVRLRMLAIEKSRIRFGKLKRAVEETFGPDYRDIELRRGTLAQYLDRFLEYVRQAPVLYFIDPWGLESIDTSLLPRLLASPQSEVLALFSDVGALRLYALTRTHTPDFAREMREALGIMSLFGDEDRDELVQAELDRIARSQRGYSNRASAEAILTGALGGDWEAAFQGLRLVDVPKRAVELHTTRLHDAAARFVTPFSVCGADRQHKYYLLHATKSARGVEAFKRSIARAIAGSPQGEGFTFQTDVSAAVRTIEEHFAEREVPWTGDGETVQQYALSHTPLFPSDLAGVKQALTEKGYRLPGQRIVYRFPPILPH